MLIWLTVLLLVAIFAALGYAKGAIRMIFPLIGLFVGIWLALPLAPLMRPLVPKMGLENPVWSILLPPVMVFFIVALILVAVGFVVHWKLNLYFKYRTDEYQYQRWLRLNQRVGISMGLVAGVVYSLLIGVIVYSLGYLTVQVSAGDTDPAAVRYLNKAREDLHSSGLENAVASFAPVPEIYYSAADVLGLLYHNPLLHSRLATYPP
ncbi:MAG: CvpA family protein, partial [Halieaceae bacterium]|nr:CvpA family protein [Halieaceae bacterium]